MSTIQFTSRLFQFCIRDTNGETSGSRKNPDQSRPQYDDVGSGFQGIVELKTRESFLQSEKGLDTQSFIYQYYRGKPQT